MKQIRVVRNIGLFVGLVVLVAVLLSVSEHRMGKITELNSKSFEFVKQGQSDEAIKCLDSAILLSSQNPVLYLNKGLILLRKFPVRINLDNFSKGEQIVYDYPQNLDSMLLLFKKASELNPEDPVFLHNIAWCYILKNDFDNGDFYLQKALGKAPNDYILLMSKGVVEEHKRNTELAVSCYAKAVSISPFLLDSPFFFVLARRDSNMVNTVMDDAKRILEDTLMKDNSYAVKSKLAKVLYNMGKIAIAEKMLEEVTENYPSFNRSWLMLGKIREMQGDSLVPKYYDKAKHLDYMDPLPYYYRAVFYKQRGNEDLSERYYRIALNQNSFFRTDYYARSRQIYKIRTWENEYCPQQLLAWISLRLAPI